ncbi:MAG: hypothetical protein K6E59_02540 [Bacilli bacterium]|nr:hypothetical protein [Bacilli bacterium]
MDEIRQEEPKIVGIHCLGKWKRTLLYLGDFFIVFLLSLLLFHIATYPLGRLVVNYDGQMDSLHAAQTRRDGILYGEGLLYPTAEGATGYAEFEANLEYTSDKFIHYFVDNSVGAKYDVFARYFSIRADQPAYVSFYKTLDERYGFFDFTETTAKLKAEYVAEFAPKWNPDDTMSEKGKTDFQTFEEKIFVQGYNKMLLDIEEKDLVYQGVSYNQEQAEVSRVLSNGRKLVVTCVFATFLVVWLVNHLLVPTLNKKRKTLGMMMMRMERIHKDTYEPLSIPMGYLMSLYALAGEAFCVLFIPWGTTNFNELFSLPLLFPIALISVAFVLGSFVTLLVGSYNQTLGDLLCRSYVLGEDEFDMLIQEKGYSS